MNTRRFIVSLLLLTCLPIRADEAKITHVDAQQAAALVKTKKLLILDVRTSNEFVKGHIEGAKNVDFTENSFEEALAALDKKQRVLVHCASGARSTSSLKVFKKLGFADVTHLDGGLNAWQAAGLPVTLK